MTQTPIPGLPTTLATAQSEGRLTTASILELHSAAGATIAISTQPVLMVGTAPPPGPLRKMTAFFEGGEHTFIGDQAQLNFEGLSQPVPAATYTFTLPNQLSLRYGQIIALAGDFYGFPDRPISGDPTGQTFQDAFDSLARLPASNAEATQILADMKTEIDATNRAIADGFDPSTAYDKMGDALNKRYNYDTGGSYGFVPRGRYLLLAGTNWDHFGATAVTAYSIGHNRAQLVATEAGKLTDPNARRAVLELAYAMNAFADHFLTDLFSSGHLRTPRKEMYDLLPSVTGSLCVRMMHDEDSCYGLQVTNAKGETWTAYGDKRLRDKVNAGNLQRAEAAVQLSVDEVWHAYQGAAPASGALQLIPNFAALLANPSDHNNNSPLFVASNGQISRRSQVSNLKDYEWTSSWTSVTTWMMSGWYTNMSACGDRERLMMDRAFLAVSQNGTDPSLIVYDHTADKIIGPVGLTNVPGFNTSHILIGDINRDGLPEVININPNTNAIQAFGFSGPLAYALVDTLPLVNGDSDIGAQIIDANGDGDYRFVNAFTNFTNENVGLATYRLENSKLVVTQNTQDLGMGQPTSSWISETGIVAIDMNGDGKQQLALLYGPPPQDPSTTTQTLALFSADSTGQFSLSWKSDIPITAVPPPSFVPENRNLQWVFPVDANGDGKTELAQVFLYNNNSANPDQIVIGMHVYGPDGSGGYKEISSSFQMGPVPWGTAWFVADYDGDGRDEIILLGPTNYTPNVMLTIFKYQMSPHIHETNWYYQTRVVDTNLCPAWANFRGATVVNKHKKGSNDHLVVFWNNGGQLTMRVIGGGRSLRILADYPLEPIRHNYALFYSLELHGGDAD